MLFRNGKHIAFEAHEIDVAKLLNDVKAYIKSKPGQLNWEQLNIDNVGWRLVEKNQLQYIKGKPVAQWEMDLKPHDKHFDKHIKVTIPVKKPARIWSSEDEGWQHHAHRPLARRHRHCQEER